MDQRQPPPHPFSRNTASPYGRTPFPPSSNQTPFPPSSHPPNSTPSYPEHQRRPSDPPYYNSQRSYGQDGPPMAGPGHSRHQSASSVGHGTPVNRAMPPPSSPQQGTQQQHSNYGPPPPRAPPLSVGPPTSFPSGRELPALGQRGGMSISDILGGPPVSREAASQYGSPIATSGPPNSMFGPSHASPRMQSTGPDYAPFRRPQTPEHQRSYGPRDHRANSAGSPPGVSHYSTPEARQFGTPYRGPVAEERREPVRVPNPNAIPPRPNSQPNTFNPPPSRAPDSRPPPNDFGRRVDNVGRPPEALNRPEPPYQRPGFEDRHDPRYGYVERERQDREREAVMQREIQREREQRDQRDQREQREQRERAEQERHQEYAHQLAQRNAQAYSRAPEREQPAWMRQSYETSRPPYEQTAERPPTQQSSSGYEYPATTAPQYGGHPAYVPNESRYPQASQPPPHNPTPTSQYEASMQERQQRLAQLQQQQQQSSYSVAGQNGPYQNHESPVRRTMEDPQQMQQQRSFLGVQEINRKGRLSPLPQAVQGAQGQMNGPGGEASIKNEFGRMFSGIGSGVGSAMGVPSPITAGPQSMPFSNAGQIRRDDAESLQNSPVENGGHKIPRTASRGGRRRKLKEEDSKGDDESSTGRHTPSGRGKRAKTHHHHHHHHHHHRPDPQENTSSPNLTPFKSIKGSAMPSPPGPDKDVPNLHHHHVPVSRPHHHHHHVTTTKPTVQVNPQVALPSITIRSNAVLDEVKNLPRRHLGHGYYEPTLKPTNSSALVGIRKDSGGYLSNPKPLPRFDKKQQNCVFTVKVPRVHLTHSSLKEITSRKALWGTDIYTDDSDVVAACIHQGWFRGAWDDSIDISLLGLELPGIPITKQDRLDTSEKVMMQPPLLGPEDIPKDHDVHVDILILPPLEGYGSTIRFGIKSREWGYKREGFQSEHDGMSFMILKVQYVSGVDGEVGRGGMERRRLFAKKLQAEELEEEDTWGDLMNGEGGMRNGSQFEESFERGGPGPSIGDIKGIGTNSWWKESNGSIKAKGKEKEVENHGSSIPEAPKTPLREVPRHYVPIDPPIPSPISVADPQIDIERVTELMIENANTAEGPVVDAAAVDEPVNIGRPTQEQGPPRSVPEAPVLPKRESEREVIAEGDNFRDTVKVKRETISESAPTPVPAEGSLDSRVPVPDTDMSGTHG